MKIQPIITLIVACFLSLSMLGSIQAELLGEPVPLPGVGTTSSSRGSLDEIPVFTESNDFYAEITCCPEAVAECCTSTKHHQCPSQCQQGGYCDHGQCQECDDSWCSFCCCHSLCCKICPQSCGVRFYPDMPGHVPYYPVNHGYYYFRPYNYLHVARHREEAIQLGLNYNAPYSHQDSFEEIYREMESSYDFPAEETESAYAPLRQELPNLQQILKMP